MGLCAEARLAYVATCPQRGIKAVSTPMNMYHWNSYYNKVEEVFPQEILA